MTLSLSRFRKVVGIPFTGMASLLIGMIQMLWSVAPLFAETEGFRKSPVSQALHYSGVGEDWLVIMLLSGMLLTLTSLTLFRSLRHVSLIFSSWVLLSTFPVLWGWGLRTLFTFTVALLGLYCIILLLVDVKYKEERQHGVN